MLWYEWGYFVALIMTSLISLFSVIWCFSVFSKDINRKRLWKSLKGAIKYNQIVTALTVLALLDFIATTFVLVVYIEPTFYTFMWALFIRMIPSNIVSFIIIFCITKIKFLEDDIRFAIKKEMIDQKIFGKDDGV